MRKLIVKSERKEYKPNMWKEYIRVSKSGWDLKRKMSMYNWNDSNIPHGYNSDGEVDPFR